ncbi:hypothetical protein K0M31_004942, partial [Melipona bicolor]
FEFINTNEVIIGMAANGISAKPCTYPIKVESRVQAITCLQKDLGELANLDLNIQITLSFITRPPQLTNDVNSKL